MITKFNTKLIKDKYFSEMVVGKSDNLVGRGESTEEEFSFRPSAGDVSIEDGTARITSIKGNSVVWNQLDDNNYQRSFSFSNINGSTSKKFGLGTCSLKRQQGHHYLIYASYVGDNDNIKLYYGNAYATLLDIKNQPHIFESPAQGTTNIFMGCELPAGESVQGIVSGQIIDLTQMFGADNEPTTYEEYLQRKPMNIANEYAYNDGTIVDMNVSSIKSVGDNAWDEEWEVGSFSTSTGENVASKRQIRSKNLIKIIPGATYYITTSSGCWVIFYDAYKNVISNPQLTTNDQHAKNGNSVNCGEASNSKTLGVPNNASYMRFYTPTSYGNVYNNDICIMLAHSNYKNDVYSSYEYDTKDLSWIYSIKDDKGNLLFENGLLAAGTAYDEIRYNVTTKKWEAVKRIGELALSSIPKDSWSVVSFNGNNSFRVSRLSLGIKSNNTEAENVISSKYIRAGNKIYLEGLDKSFEVNHQYYGAITTRDYIAIRDTAYTNIDAFVQSLVDDNVTLYYELAEPIVVEIPDSENWNFDYLVWDFGTEEVIASESSAPFRADIVYQFNAVDKIRNNSTKIEGLETKINKNTADIATKQKTLSLTVKDNGNIVIGNFVNNQSREFMPATPSGDPMHYAYEAEGAVYNDSDVALEKIDWFGKTIIHEPHKWYLNGLGDLSNKEMAKIYSLGRFSPSVQAPLSYSSTSYPNYATTVRTNIARLGMYNGIVSNSYFATTNYVIETINISIASQTPQGTTTINSAYTFDNCKKLKSIYGVIKLNGTATGTFTKCNQLQDIKISSLSLSLSLADSPLLTKESLLYMIENCESNAKFTITLHPDVYAKCTRVDEGEAQYEGEWWVDIDTALGYASNTKNTTITLASA